MLIHRLPPGDPGAMPATWNLDEATLAACPRIDDYAREAAALRARGAALRQVPIADLVAFFDGLADDWLRTKGDALRALGPHGLGFALAFLRRENLSRLLRAALRGDERVLDGFVDLPDLGHRVMAHPRGLVTHWLAGNVPVLGLLFDCAGGAGQERERRQGPARVGAPAALGVGLAAGRARRRRARGRPRRGRVGPLRLLRERRPRGAVGPVAGERRAGGLGRARGGRRGHDAAPARGDRRRRLRPEISLAVLGRDALDERSLARAADALALDVSIDDQRGCHSPHLVFVEDGGAVDARRFAAALAAALERALARVPKPPVSPADAYRVASVRAAWTLDGTVHASRGTAWTVVCSETAGFDDRCGGRVVFVRPIADVMDVLPLLGPGQQAVGLLLDPGREPAFALGAAARGVARLTRLGQMARFDYPWDGTFPIDRFVRWVSLD